MALTITKRKLYIYQFAFKQFPSMKEESMLDCRVLKNPFKWGVADEVLKQDVQDDPKFEQIVQKGLELIKKHGHVYVGCQYGKHRSGAVTEALAKETGALVTHL